ncbi:MAG TPA: DUF2202 domain-containing protein [Dissulfurispiraceae bacterium]|nr:DUF2202 domain-containing protein [Dissulfurispiraceae bacterium]
MKFGLRVVQSALMGLLILAAVLVTLIDTPAWAAKNGGSATQSLTPAEAADLTYMREEEKLARDVYLTMLGQYNAVIFSNISNSEQQHMDTMLKMLVKYSLPDPALPGIGVFTNQYLQTKYNELVAAGLTSYIDALKVGATIEEIDMVDIQKAIDGTSRVDLRTAYQNLLEGSKNHLRAYVTELAAQGITYAPQFLSQDLYDAIIGI